MYAPQPPARPTTLVPIAHRSTAMQTTTVDTTSEAPEQQSTSSTLYETYQQHSQGGTEVKDEEYAMVCLVAAVHQANPDPRALYEASQSPQYAELYNELPDKSTRLSPEQCLQMANPLEAEFKLTVKQFGEPLAVCSLREPWQIRHHALVQTDGLNTLREIAKTGHLGALVKQAEFFLALYPNSMDSVINLNNNILRHIHATADQETYINALMTVAKLYGNKTSILFNKSEYIRLLYDAHYLKSGEAAYLLAIEKTKDAVPSNDIENDVPEINIAVLDLVKQAHENGYSDAGFKVGEVYHKDSRPSKLDPTAIACYKIAADNGDIEAAFKLVKLLHFHNSWIGVTVPNHSDYHHYLAMVENEITKPNTENLKLRLGEWYLTGYLTKETGIVKYKQKAKELIEDLKRNGVTHISDEFPLMKARF